MAEILAGLLGAAATLGVVLVQRLLKKSRAHEEDYWKNKATRHKKAARWWGTALLFYAIGGSAGLAAIFYVAYTHAYDLASTGEAKFSHLLLLISGAVAAGTTILFWIGRFVQRLYLSERHMAIDAKLRETMAMTYWLYLRSNRLRTAIAVSYLRHFSAPARTASSKRRRASIVVSR